MPARVEFCQRNGQIWDSHESSRWRYSPGRGACTAVRSTLQPLFIWRNNNQNINKLFTKSKSLNFYCSNYTNDLMDDRCLKWLNGAKKASRKSWRSSSCKWCVRATRKKKPTAASTATNVDREPISANSALHARMVSAKWRNNSFVKYYFLT